ncbi:MAG: hypothetical protein HOW97_07965 [Catenulispora sp.]|nr:hypothetical protein [Catenulispora sp.]
MTLPSSLAPFVRDVADVAEDKPATTLAQFIESLKLAVGYLYLARYDVDDFGDGFRTAINLLDEAAKTEGADRDALINRAAGHLRGFAKSARQYQAMG